MTNEIPPVHTPRREIKKSGRKKTSPGLTLTRFKAGVLLVNDVNAALALDHLAVTIAFFQRFQGVNDFHDSILCQNSGRTLPIPAPAVKRYSKIMAKGYG